MPARLGELLIEAGLLTEAELGEALRVQVVWGGRLGTVIAELGYLELDTVSRVLGWQHGLPPALAKHFEHADRELQHALGRELAEQHGAVPLLRAGNRIVLASMSPLDATAAETIARKLGITPDRIIPSIAPELRIRYQLEHVYMISRPHRFLRSRGTELTPSGGVRSTRAVDAVPDLTDQLDDVYPEGVLDQPSERNSDERRTYVTTLADGVVEAVGESREPSTPMLIGRKGVHDDALRALRDAKDRAAVADLAIEAVAAQVAACRAATLLVVRGQAATSWVSFQRTGVQTKPLAVALDRAGLARTVIQRRMAVHAAAGDLTEPDYLLLTALDPDEGDLLIAPIIADGAVVALLVAAVAPGAFADGLGAITEAAGSALARLMRDASQPNRL